MTLPKVSMLKGDPTVNEIHCSCGQKWSRFPSRRSRREKQEFLQQHGGHDLAGFHKTFGIARVGKSPVRECGV